MNTQADKGHLKGKNFAGNLRKWLLTRFWGEMDSHWHFLNIFERCWRRHYAGVKSSVIISGLGGPSMQHL